MKGSLLQPGRDGEGLCLPGSHRVTGWAAISRSRRASSSSRVSPTNTRLLAFRRRLKCVFFAKLIKLSPDVGSRRSICAQGSCVKRCLRSSRMLGEPPKLARFVVSRSPSKSSKFGESDRGVWVVGPVFLRNQPRRFLFPILATKMSAPWTSTFTKSQWTHAILPASRHTPT